MKVHKMSSRALDRAYGKAGTVSRLKRDRRAFESFQRGAIDTLDAPEDYFGQVHWVPMKWVNELHAKIQHLHGDMKAHFAEPNPDHLLGIWPLEGEWRDYWGSWMAWKTAHQSNWSRTGQEAETAYYNFRSQYNDFLRRFKEAGGETTAEEANGDGDGDGKSLFTFSGGVSAGVIAAVAIGVTAVLLLRK